MNLLREYNKAMTYQTYVNRLGEYNSLHQLHYNKFVIPQEAFDQIKQYAPLQILVITEPWCGDSLALLPIIRKIAEVNKNWTIRLLLRDENPDLMNRFLTKDARAIPIFLFLNDVGDLLFRWGPRPKEAADIYDKYHDMIQKGKIEKQSVIKKIRTYYAKDKGVATVKELLEVFKKHSI